MFIKNSYHLSVSFGRPAAVFAVGPNRPGVAYEPCRTDCRCRSDHRRRVTYRPSPGRAHARPATSGIAHFHTETEGVETLRRRGALRIAADLATELGVQELIRTVQASTTSLRALVHNASAFEMTAPEVG